MKVSRIIDKAGTTLLWITAGLTLGILLLILGFILYRGFVSDNLLEYKVLDSREDSLLLPWEDRPLSVVVSDDVHISKMTSYDMEEIFSGKVRNWGNLSEQDIPVQPLTTAVLAVSIWIFSGFNPLRILSPIGRR